MTLKAIAISSTKGGASKTTVSINLHQALNALGYKTLLIDTDYQCNATSRFKGFTYSKKQNSYQLLRFAEVVSIKDYIVHSDKGDFIPCTPRMRTSDAVIAMRDEQEKFSAFKDLLDQIKNEYEYVIFDTRPNLDDLITTIFYACDYYIVPVTTADTINGMYFSHQYSEAAKKTLGCTNPEFLGVVLSQYRSRSKAQDEIIEKYLSPEELAKMNTSLFNTHIHFTTKFDYCANQEKTIFDLYPRSREAKEYIALAKEIITRTGGKKK